ncbi:hypothetical protein SEA_ASHBALLER_93 [Mycobacterium phage Ashballer]|nr:hypothetical protein SEA_ASHBALLER_93 [Mycobacterium phage Ashballer]
MTQVCDATRLRVKRRVRTPIGYESRRSTSTLPADSWPSAPLTPARGVRGSAWT